jgi:hypothetical protein
MLNYASASKAKLPDQKKRAVKTRPFGREEGILMHKAS